MKKSLFLALTVAFLVGCNQESTKSADQRVQDPTLVAPSSELLAQLKLAEVGRAAVAETLVSPGASTLTSSAWPASGQPSPAG